MSDKPKADDGGAAAAVYSKLYHEGRAKREQLERELSALCALIADDSYAMTFQSIGQYRTALLSHLNQPPCQNRNSKSRYY